MADIVDLKVALWQREIREGSPRRSREELECALAKARELGADCLVANTFEGEDKLPVIPCGDAAAEYGACGLNLKTGHGAYRIGIGDGQSACDVRVIAVEEPWFRGRQALTAPKCGAPAIVVSPVGIRNAGHAVRCFDGGSAVYDAQGAPMASLRDDFEEDLKLVSLGRTGELAKPCKKKLLEALTSTVRRFDEQVLGGTLTWVIGLSGGLDSSTVATLLVHALGADRVLGYSLPTAFNSKMTRDNAANLAESLGIGYRIAPIEDVVEATGGALEKAGYGPEAMSGLVLENVQARIRGHMLCTFAAIERGVVANNGNFVEAALGYATMYGDAIGALAPIGDLAKTDLFDLARDLNESFGRIVIPENLLPTLTEDGYEWEMMPSAELASGQRDPMKWFYHDWLIRKLAGRADEGAIEVMEAYRADQLASQGMDRWVRFYGLDDPRAFVEDLGWVLKQMRMAVYKRIQSVPTILACSAAPAFGESEVQHPWEPSARFEELKDELVSL